MRLKENTEQSSNQIRGIASLVLALGIALAIVFIFIGISAIADGAGSNYYSSSFIETLLSSKGILFLVIGGILFLYHYVAYVMISAYATLIENSDRTDVVEALYEINKTLKHNTHELTEYAMEENDEEVETEIIDNSEIDDD